MNKRSSASLASSPSTKTNTREVHSPFVRAFLKRVQNTVAEYSLWGPTESFVVAVSGGPDSLCLLDVLVLLSRKYDFTLHVAHVNYRLRGTDSDNDETLVRERVESYGLTLSVYHPKKTSIANLEEKLRDLRYRFLEKVRRDQNATLIAVAHHEDDQAETFLLRLLRGSGMQGLSAMRPKHSHVVRPLLHLKRVDILRYLKERQISFRTDQSNSDPAFLRNRLRHELLPFLKRDYQPRISTILAKTATRLATDLAFFEETLALTPTEKRGVFSAQALLALPDPLLRHRLRLILRPYSGNRFPTEGIVNEVLKILKSTKNKPQSASLGGLKIERKGDRVRLLRQGA